MLESQFFVSDTSDEGEGDPFGKYQLFFIYML
jgi:hypothetical protein